ncbi:MAG: hypothetical protein LBB81_03950 [Treponema sp.]|jgi:hypothetical protein|nr:hypothetical protein [Treponema sp.]
MKKVTKIAIFIFFPFLSISCIGISSDIRMKKDGSGRITLEYRYMRKLESIGRLDGNENWPIIPAGKRDIERTTARITGLKLVSYSSRETASQTNADKDILTKITLDFNTTRALLDFLDPANEKTAYIQNGNTNMLNIILIRPVSSGIDPELINLLRGVSERYQFKFNFSADKNINLAFTDGAGKLISAPAGAETVSSGRKVSFIVNTVDFFNYPQGFGVALSW